MLTILSSWNKDFKMDDHAKLLCFYVISGSVPAAKSIWGHPHRAEDEEQEHCPPSGENFGQRQWGATGAGGVLPQEA